jgi:hypothetical protein
VAHPCFQPHERGDGEASPDMIVRSVFIRRGIDVGRWAEEVLPQ